MRVHFFLLFGFDKGTQKQKGTTQEPRIEYVLVVVVIIVVLRSSSRRSRSMAGNIFG